MGRVDETKHPCPPSCVSPHTHHWSPSFHESRQKPIMLHLRRRFSTLVLSLVSEARHRGPKTGRDRVISSDTLWTETGDGAHTEEH